MSPKKKKLATEQTTDELLERIFSKEVQGKLKEALKEPKKIRSKKKS